MKYSNLFSILICSLLFLLSCGDDDEYGTPLNINYCNGEIIAEMERINATNLSVSEIPNEIRNYVATELPGFGITEGLSYSDQNNNNYYLIGLNNNGQLLFDQEQNFICAEGDFSSSEDDEYLSFEQLPEAIQNYLNENYPGIEIDEAEFEDNEYKVELKNGIELCFDHLGNFKGEC